MSENNIFQKSEFYIELANIQHKTTIQIHKCSQYNLQPIPFYAPDALLWKRATKPFKCVRKKWQQEFCQSKRKIKENMQIFINIFSFYCFCLDFNPPPQKKKKKNGSWNSPRNNFTTNQHSLPKKKKMVVGIAQEIILQPIKSKYSCRSRIKTLKILKTWKSLQRQNSS